MRELPKNYPNIYFHDMYNHNYPSVTFIRFAVTPTGRIGRDYEQYRFYFKPDGKNSKKTNEEIIALANINTQPKRLRKGYKWGELFVQHDFTDRGFITS